MHEMTPSMSPVGWDAADPLAEIPEQEDDNPRGDAATVIFRVPNAVRSDECEALLDLFRLYDKSGHTKSLTHSTRLNRVYLGGCQEWEKMHPGIFVPSGTEKLPARLSSLIQAQNLEHWKFAMVPYPVLCIAPAVTLDLQGAGDEGVPWHSDFTSLTTNKGKDFEPKLVAIVQLSDPSDYEGGEFEVYSGTQIVRPELEQGDMILFPSFLLHRRQPITRGHRFILMAQAWGPHWR